MASATSVGRLVGVVLSLSTLLAPRSAQAQELGASWVITGGSLIDGTAAAPVHAAVVVGSGDRISCAGTAQQCQAPADAAEFDARGKWIVPGLIDTHIHLNWAQPDAARRAQLVRFAFGTTTVREAGTDGSLTQNLARKAPSNVARSPEPRLVVSALTSDEVMQHYQARDVESLVRAVAADGVDQIKVKRDYSAEDWRALVAAAHEVGLPVWGHTWTESQSRLAEALAAGIDGLAHMYTFVNFDLVDNDDDAPPVTGNEMWLKWLEQWQADEPRRLEGRVRAMVDRGVWFEPMLTVEKYFTLPYPHPAADSFITGGPSLRQSLKPWLPASAPVFTAEIDRRARVERVYARMCAFLERYVAWGGMVVTGTDNGTPWHTLSEEVSRLEGCGLTPLTALRAATGHAALAVRRDDIGTVEAGKLADLVLLDADPLSDAANLRRVWRVIKGGYVHNPAVLLAPLRTDYEERNRPKWLLVGLLFLIGGSATLIRRLRFRRRARPRPATVPILPMAGSVAGPG